MADGTTLDPGTGGDLIATDDLGATGKVQWVKLRDGTDGGTQTIASGGGTEAASLRVTVASDSTGVLSVDDNGGSLTVDAASLPLPAGASTAAKQPALGTAGTASADVISVQGIASMTALKVDGSAVTQPVSGTVTASGPLTDTQLRATAVPVSGTVNLGTAAVTNAGTFAVQDSEKLADDAAFTVGTTKLAPVGYLADQTSTDSVNEGDIGAARITLDRKQIVTLAPSADTEGLSVSNNIDIDESEDAVKASAGKLYGWFLYNDGAAEVYVKFYNDTVANVVVGTTVPFMTIPVPAGAAANVEFSMGIPFSAAITVAATTAVTTADTGAPATNQVVGCILYQ